MRHAWPAWGGLLLLASTLACSPLPELSSGMCGNFLVEEGEACDGVGTHCIMPPEPFACSYACAPDGSCPQSFDCGSDGICRRGTGEFQIAGEPLPFVWPMALEVGDFDIDGSPDLLVLGKPDSVGQRPARALLSDGFTLSEGLASLPLEVAVPAVGAGATQDLGRDVAFADFTGVALLHGYPDHSSKFSIFPSHVLPLGTSSRFVLLEVLPDLPGDEIVGLLERDDESVSLARFSDAFESEKLVTLPGGEDDLVGPDPIFAARLDEQAECSQIVFAFEGKASVPFFSPCRLGASGAEWNVGGSLSYVTLPPGANVDRGVLAVDVDIDGHLDLVIGAKDRTYVAFGLGDGTFVSDKTNGVLNEAAPRDLVVVSGNPIFPLAIADLNGDGQSDFVVPTGVVISSPSGPILAYKNVGAPWTEAVIADLNGNDLSDVVASAEGAVDIDFLNNAGKGVFAPAALSTEGPITQLTVGDFDGDLLNDIAFNERLFEEDEELDHVGFAFGAPFGPPTETVVAGHVHFLEQLGVGRLVGPNGLDAMSELVIMTDDKVTRTDGLAFLYGRSSRGMFSTSPLLDDASSTLLPIALAFGDFGYSTADVAALALNGATGELRLFRVAASDDGEPGLPRPSLPLPANFQPADPLGAANFRYGAVIATAQLDADETPEEVVMAAPYGPSSMGAALLVADYNKDLGTFEDRAPLKFQARLTVDSRLVLDDVDGDTYVDALLTTGSSDEPLELLIFWGGGPGKYFDAENISHINPDGDGVRAVACLPARSGGGREVIVSTRNGTPYRVTHGGSRKIDPQLVPSLPTKCRAFGAADFDRDGVTDLAVQTDDGLVFYQSVPGPS